MGMGCDVNDTSAPLPNGATGKPEDPVHVRSDTIPVGLVIRLFLLGWALAVLIPLGVFFSIRWYDQDNRIEDIESVATTNQSLVKELSATQREFRQFVAEQCAQAEARDVVQVEVNLAITRFLGSMIDQETFTARQLATLDMFLQSLADANATLEPEGEKDCVPGPEGGNP
jgi:hypothetical protein